MTISPPPQELREYVGPGDFETIGRNFRDLFRRLGGLTAADDVLDVGCGSGRMAIPLTDFLVGRYEGLDINPDAIRWCQEHITPSYPSFRFQVADVSNTRYNPHGEIEATGYRFPYDDESFDFVFLTSVFTHLLPDAARTYLREIRRVLRPRGRCFSTWNLLNAESEEAIARGRARQAFPHDFGEFRAMSAKRPEAVVAFYDDIARIAIKDAGLEITDVHYGQWAGRTEGPTTQDIIIAIRP